MLSLDRYLAWLPRPRLRHYLALSYTLLIVYASLSPFSGWRAQGLDFTDVLVAPWAQTYNAFDATVNFLAYLPFGLLLALGLLDRLDRIKTLLLCGTGGALLSCAMEFLQMYLPSRTSSNIDLITNASGALAGGLVAAAIANSHWFSHRLIAWRDQLVVEARGIPAGQALIALWIFAQINPAMPLLGTVFISEVAKQPFVPPIDNPFDWLECATETLNLTMLGMLLLNLMRRRRDAFAATLLILISVMLFKFLAAALLLKSWALLLWLNAEAMLGILAGLTLIALLSWLLRRHLVWIAALTALAYLAVAYRLEGSATPSSAIRLYHWHYGHLINYNGLSQTITLLFPVLMLGFLWRVRRRPAAL